MAPRKANPAGCSLRLILFIFILQFSCITSVSSFKNIFSSALWGRSLLPRKRFVSKLSFQLQRGGGDEQTQAGETSQREEESEELESEYETEDEESMWIGDDRPEKRSQAELDSVKEWDEDHEEPKQHQVDADSWFEDDQEVDEDEEIADEDEEDLGVTDLDDQEELEGRPGGELEEEMEEEFYDALEEVEEDEDEDTFESEENIGEFTPMEVEVKANSVVSENEEEFSDADEISERDMVGSESIVNSNGFEVNEVVANYPEGSVGVAEVVEGSAPVNEIEPSMDDEGSSPTDLYPEEPDARPETVVKEEEDLTNAGTADDLTSPPVEESVGHEAEEQPVFVSDASVHDGGILPMGSGGIQMELAHPHITDDDSTAFVDRMELADAEDEGETTAGGYGDSYNLDEESRTIPANAPTGAGPTAHSRSMEEDLPVENPVEAETSPDSQAHSPEAPTERSEDKIDDAKIRILRRELRYTPHEVKCMKPEIAAVVVEKKLKRPQEGIPLNWYASGKGPDKLDKIKRIAKPALMAAFAGYVVLQNGGVLPRRMSKKSTDNESTEELANVVNETASAVEESLGDIPMPNLGDEDEHTLEQTRISEQDKGDQGNWLEQLMTACGNKLNEILNIPASFFKRFQ